jgi:hypothetical protein
MRSSNETTRCKVFWRGSAKESDDGHYRLLRGWLERAGTGVGLVGTYFEQSLNGWCFLLRPVKYEAPTSRKDRFRHSLRFVNDVNQISAGKCGRYSRVPTRLNAQQEETS